MAIFAAPSRRGRIFRMRAPKSPRNGFFRGAFLLKRYYCSWPFSAVYAPKDLFPPCDYFQVKAPASSASNCGPATGCTSTACSGNISLSLST